MARQEGAGTLGELLKEARVFPPPEAFKQQAHVNDPAIYEQGRDLEAFWAEQAQNFEWFRKWDKVLEWDPPWAPWFVGAKLNITVNGLDRHLKTWRRTKAAIVWEGEPGDERVLTYQDLHREVGRFANGLKRLGVKKGDRSSSAASALTLWPSASGTRAPSW